MAMSKCPSCGAAMSGAACPSCGYGKKGSASAKPNPFAGKGAAKAPPFTTKSAKPNPFAAKKTAPLPSAPAFKPVGKKPMPKGFRRGK